MKENLHQDVITQVDTSQLEKQRRKRRCNNEGLWVDEGKVGRKTVLGGKVICFP